MITITSSLYVMDDATKPSTSHHNGETAPSKPITSLFPHDNMANWRRNLTGSQRQMLARAWDKNGTPPNAAGWKVFLKIFELNPEVLLQFGVQARSPEQLGYDEKFVAHTQVFGEALDFVAKRLPNDHSM